ncbi:MAG TPA: phage protein Gp36 family protein [Thermoanaerobaculia bacterium]|nr:phage protein Gp36 family protein [Thermoanaerobaculia bacterium]
MPRFLEVAELYARKGGEARVLGLAGSGEEAAVEQAIASAEELAASILLPAYGEFLPSLPADTPTLMKDLVASVALYKLTESHDQVNPRLLADHDQALAHFRLVGRGGASLGFATSPAVDVSRPGILTTHTADQARLTLANLEDM